jgi:hypothetical protein
MASASRGFELPATSLIAPFLAADAINISLAAGGILPRAGLLFRTH